MGWLQVPEESPDLSRLLLVKKLMPRHLNWHGFNCRYFFCMSRVFLSSHLSQHHFVPVSLTDQDSLASKLGADPLREDANADDLVKGCSAAKPIATVLVDQAVCAGERGSSHARHRRRHRGTSREPFGLVPFGQCVSATQNHPKPGVSGSILEGPCARLRGPRVRAAHILIHQTLRGMGLKSRVLRDRSVCERSVTDGRAAVSLKT